MAYLLGIDIGTSGTKTVLFDEKGNGLASYTGEYGMQQPKNGWAEQHPQDWWEAVVDGIRAVLAKSGADSAEIAGIGLSGQMHGLTMLDKDNKVLRPAIIWCDQRTAQECAEIEALMGGRDRLIAITANPALTGFTAGKIRWVQKHEPEIYEKCAHILLPKDYIRLMLTGEYATEVSDASGMQLLDVPGRCWSDTVLEKLGIDKSLLGKVFFHTQEVQALAIFSAKLCHCCSPTFLMNSSTKESWSSLRISRPTMREAISTAMSEISLRTSLSICFFSCVISASAFCLSLIHI